MIKALLFLLPVSLSTLFGCHPNQESFSAPIIPPDSAQEATVLVATAKQANGLAPDSIDAYRPAFGASSTVRQFPYGLATRRAEGPQLASVSFNGRIIRTFQYDGQGRLTERTDFYTNGIQVYRKFAYTYGPNGLERINSFLNKEAGTVEGFPKQSELRPSTTVSYASASDSLALIRKTTAVEFLDWYQKPGTTIIQLGFSASGALVWEEKTNEQGQLSEYTLYRRNESNNVVLRRKGFQFNRWETHQFTYDDKPNPFRTTGDSQSLDLGELSGIDVMNPNNVATQSFASSQGGREIWHYAYEYRTDGYPAQVTVYRGNRQAGSYGFMYK